MLPVFIVGHAIRSTKLLECVRIAIAKHDDEKKLRFLSQNKKQTHKKISTSEFDSSPK